MDEETRLGGTDASNRQATSANGERRKESREKFRVNKLFPVDILLGDTPKHSFIYIVDLSLHGMKITTDFSFPEGEVPLRILLDKPVEMRVQSAWQRELYGGMYTVGLKFLDEEGSAPIQRLVQKYHPENKRKSLRLNKLLTVEMKIDSQSRKFQAFTIDISTQGMKITNDFPLPTEKTVEFLLHLEPNFPPVLVTTRVVWQKPTSLETHAIGLEFVNPDDQAVLRITRFIEEMSEGTSFTTRVLPEVQL